MHHNLFFSLLLLRCSVSKFLLAGLCVLNARMAGVSLGVTIMFFEGSGAVVI